MVESNQPQTQLDRLQIIQDKKITEKFNKGEYVVLSTNIDKYNHVNKRQTRILVITNQGIYNIKKQGTFKSIFKDRVRRRIEFQKIVAITVSRFGQEFIIHVPPEHDYRLQSSDFRSEILLAICQQYYQSEKQKLGFYYRDDFTLIPFTTTKVDVKKGVSRIPQESPEYPDPDKFMQLENRKASDQMIYSTNQGKSSLSINDFEMIKVLGKGAFGKVVLCKKKETNDLYAIKQIRKDYIIENDQTEHIKTERKILEQVNHPFLVGLQYAFQTKERLFFVMNFLRGGELFFHLKKAKKFEEENARFYAAQILLALDTLHKMKVVYRDLKPENILLDEDGYIKLTDYGLSKFLNKGEKTLSFVGTPEYLAPEIITQKGHSFEVDYWSLGVLIYEMLTGVPPWYNQNQKVMFELIVKTQLIFKKPVSPEAQDLLTKLLHKDPKQRLCKVEEVQFHPFFKPLNFDDLYNKKIQPQFLPNLFSEEDVSNFDKHFTNIDPTAESYIDDSSNKMLKHFQNEFNGITYVGDKQIDMDMAKQ